MVLLCQGHYRWRILSTPVGHKCPICWGCSHSLYSNPGWYSQSPLMPPTPRFQEDLVTLMVEAKGMQQGQDLIVHSWSDACDPRPVSQLALQVLCLPPRSWRSEDRSPPEDRNPHLCAIPPPCPMACLSPNQRDATLPEPMLSSTSFLFGCFYMIKVHFNKEKIQH